MPAVGLALLGFFSFTLMDLSIKWLLQSYGLLQVTFFNCLFGLLGLLIWTYPNFNLLKTQHPRIHILRAVLVLIADLLAFYSYGQLPLAEAYTLILTMPLFTALFAFLLRQEQVRLQTLLLTVLGFIGVYITLNPSFGSLKLALLTALGCAIIEATSFLLIARYREQETPQSFAVYSLSLVVLVTGIYTLFHYQPMSLIALTLSLGGGLCYALAMALVVSAFHRGSATAVSSMQYTQLLWGMLLSFLLWHELPSKHALVGGLLVASAGLMLLYTQRPKAKQIKQQLLPDA
ncbi:DMT family transporter [uncultured Thiothrix sp.]|uniref:DMT family transporter n=1 Tax=uncultured Thiothrix sp. TaxID=223185 RepID=UPI002627B121|nr:DMT family transporter [uncultured Thiothrix sp.]